MKTTQMYIEYVIAGFVLLAAILFTISDVSLGYIFLTKKMWNQRSITELLSFLTETGSIFLKVSPALIIPILFGVSAILGVVAVSFGFREGAKNPLCKWILWHLFGVTSEKELTQYVLVKTVLSNPKDNNIAIQYFAKNWSTPFGSLTISLLIIAQSILHLLEPGCSCTVFYNYTVLVLLGLTYAIFIFSMVGDGDNCDDGFLLSYNGLAGRFESSDLIRRYRSFSRNRRCILTEIELSYYELRARFLNSGNKEAIKQFKSRWMQARMAGIMILPVLLLTMSYTIFLGWFASCTKIVEAPGAHYKLHFFWLSATSLQVFLLLLFWILIIVYKRRIYFMVKFMVDHILAEPLV